MRQTFEKKSEMPASASDLFAYHARKGAFSRLTPPFERARVVQEIDALRDDAKAVVEVSIGPVKQRMVATHHDVVEGKGFVDRQLDGPFAFYEHTHSFEDGGDGTSILVDRVVYELPRVPLGDVVAGDYARRRFERVFAHRHATTRLDLELARALPGPALRVGLTGASGLVGQEVASLLSVLGHDVRRFARGGVERPGDIAWDPSSGAIDEVAAAGLDAVVHLAGEPIVGRLTADHKAKVMASRRDLTSKLVARLARLQTPPKSFVSASAIGLYGDAASQRVDETTPRGRGFLADVCEAWERAAEEASTFARVAKLRIGLALSPKGGALARFLPPFELGVGGPLGDGKQGMSPIAIDDLGAMFARAVVDERVRGACNAVMPGPMDNLSFTETLASVLGRKAPLRVPKTALRLAFGELADEALLASCFGVPARYEALGHRFRHGTLEAALRHVLGR
jgi:uncharacterized protein (TIGR01777 family)